MVCHFSFDHCDGYARPRPDHWHCRDLGTCSQKAKLCPEPQQNRHAIISNPYAVLLADVLSTFGSAAGIVSWPKLDLLWALEPLYAYSFLGIESRLVDFVSFSHTAKRLPPQIRICLVCYQKEIWSKEHGSNWGLQESQIRHSFSQVSEIFQVSVDLASFQLLEKPKKVCPRHVQVCPSGNFPTFI